MRRIPAHADILWPEQFLTDPDTAEDLGIEASEINGEAIFPGILQCSMVTSAPRLAEARMYGVKKMAPSVQQ